MMFADRLATEGAVAIGRVVVAARVIVKGADADPRVVVAGLIA